MTIEEYGANYRMVLSEREIKRIVLALQMLIAQDPSYYKDETEMRDCINACRRFGSTRTVDAVGQRAENPT